MRGVRAKAFHALRARVHLSCLSKKDGTRKKDTPAPRPACIHALRVRVRRQDFSTPRPCADEKRRASCTPPCGSIRRRPPLRRGPEKQWASCPHQEKHTGT